MCCDKGCVDFFIPRLLWEGRRNAPQMRLFCGDGFSTLYGLKIIIFIIDLDVFRQLPEFRQSQNWKIFLQKTFKNTQVGRESRLLVARVGCRLITEPDFRPTYDLWMPTLKADFPAMIAGTYVKIRNAKMNWKDDSLTQCAACNDVRTFALLSVSMAVFWNIKYKSTFFSVINLGT